MLAFFVVFLILFFVIVVHYLLTYLFFIWPIDQAVLICLMFGKGCPSHWTLARSRADNLWQKLVPSIDRAEGGCHSEALLLNRKMVVSPIIVHIKLRPRRRVLPSHILSLLGAISEPLVVESLYLCICFIEVLLSLSVAHCFSE